jgi:hypothetical protein
VQGCGDGGSVIYPRVPVDIGVIVCHLAEEEAIAQPPRSQIWTPIRPDIAAVLAISWSWRRARSASMSGPHHSELRADIDEAMQRMRPLISTGRKIKKLIDETAGC